MSTSTEKKLPPLSEGRLKSVTLQDVANVAGVTAMTVSRVIKGKTDVSAATREKVLRIAQELNYTANLAARALVTGRTGAVAIVSGHLNQPYFANMVNLLESELSISGYQMKLLLSQGELKSLLNSTNAAAVDGVIVLHDMGEDFRSMEGRVVQPCVYIGISKPENTDYVYSNLAPAVEEVLELMINADRQRIAYVGVGTPGKILSQTDQEVRTKAYLHVMEKAGREAELISATPRQDVVGMERVRVLKEYFQAKGCPDAIVCMNDDIAIQVYRALMDLGKRIPEDALLVGCDGLPIMEYFEPPLSTIAQPLEEMCATAWKFLQNRIAQPELPFQTISFDAKLAVRRSLTAAA